jgi:hypothetical protein
VEFGKIEDQSVQVTFVKVHKGLKVFNWGDYSNPESYYLKSLEIVKNLDRSSFTTLVGPESQDLLNEVLHLGKIWK